jgi:hypothetical protein
MFNIIDPVLLNYGLIVSIVILCTFVYILFNLYRKVKIYENWSVILRAQVEKLQQDVSEVDTRGLFENDDDVGFIFSEISDLIENLDHGVNPKNKKEQ